MKWFRGVLAAVMLSTVAVPALAQANYGFDGTYWGSSGPYYGWVGGTGVPFLAPGTYMDVDMYCVDAHNYVTVGNTWRARFTSLGDGDILQTRYGMNQGGLTQLNGFTVQQRYLQAAWLATQMTQANRYAVHSAMWNLFTVGPTATGYSSWIANAEAWAGNGYGGVNPNSWYVVTDINTQNLVDNGRSKQEYLVHVTPEPATLILMGTGLIAVAGMTVVMRQSVG